MTKKQQINFAAFFDSMTEAERAAILQWALGEMWKLWRLGWRPSAEGKGK